MRRRTTVVAVSALVAGLTALLPGVPAGAAPAQSSVVSVVPRSGLPEISSGAVYAAVQVGGTMVVGGSFTTVALPGGGSASTPYVLAFDAAGGALRTAFAPRLDGIVNAVLPGPTAGTVYVGGTFKNAGGVAARSLVLLDLSDGSRVSSFALPPSDGNVQTLEQVGGHLLVGGTFTTVGGVPRGGVVSLDPTTGADDGYLRSTVTGHHNWTPASPAGAAKAAVGVFRLAVTPDGSKMVGIGNFTQVDGSAHDQIAMWDLPTGGAPAALRAWGTTALTPACLAATYDSYVRDVDFSPDGTYFSLVNTGGYREGALCDSASRWETAATGQDVRPTWVAYTGQDSLLSTAVTGTAVYVGGHQRWLNNGLAHDSAGPGAVPRPGLAALDPANGLPLAWNPGRNPRGAGTYTLYATPAGLYTGSDTSFIGDRRTRTGRLAYFPLAGGAPAASKAVAALPGEVYAGTVPASSAPSVLARVNAGGPLLQSTDAGPDWQADTAASTAYHGAGSTTTSYGSTVPAVDATVPAGTPRAVFSSERVDPAGGSELVWHVPVRSLTVVDVRLYLAARCPCATTPGTRTFDVTVEGSRLSGVDAAASPGPRTGTVRTVRVTSDGAIDISLLHGNGDPAVSAIEIVQAGAGVGPGPAGTSAGRTFSGSAAGPATALSTPLVPSTVRGATLVGDRLFYGRTDSGLYSRPTDGRTWGPETEVDPYDDPYWSDVPTGSGDSVYRGTRPSFYDEITNLTSMWFDGTGRLYYTLYKQNGIFWRDFTPDSGILGYTRSQVTGATLPDVTGAFAAGGALYYATRADGNLVRASFDGSRLGTGTVVSGPGVDGVDWRSRVLYLGAVPPANTAPTAAFTGSCADATCTVDGTASSDADGAVASWSWSWGDGTPAGSGATATHTYAGPGTYTVTLTVTDREGATGTTAHPVTVAAPPTSSIAFHGASSLKGETATRLPVPVPAGTQPGDALLLKVSTSGTSSDPAAPAGWSEVARQVAGTSLTVLWTRAATTADTPGSTVPVTLAAAIKSSSQLLAYGSASHAAVASAADAATTTAHAAPAVAVATSGSWVVRFWTDKSSGTTAWTVPAGAVLRTEAYGTGAGYLTAVVTDDGGPVAAGTAPAATASTDVASRAASISVVLAPA